MGDRIGQLSQSLFGKQLVKCLRQAGGGSLKFCDDRVPWHGLKGLQYVPRVLITDKLKGYGVAKSPRRAQRFRSAHSLLSMATFVRDVIGRRRGIIGQRAPRPSGSGKRRRAPDKFDETTTRQHLAPGRGRFS